MMKKWWHNLCKLLIVMMLFGISVILIKRIAFDLKNKDVIILIENDESCENKIYYKTHLKEKQTMEENFYTDLSGFYYLFKTDIARLKNIKGILFFPEHMNMFKKFLLNEEMNKSFIGPIILMERIKLPEFGEITVPEKYWSRMLRGHRIPDEEIKHKAREYLVARFLRAVKERNIRVIVLQNEIKYIRFDIASELKKNNFNLKDNITPSPFYQNKFYLALTLLGIFIVIINFFYNLVSLNIRSNFLLFFFLIAGMSFLFIIEKELIAVQFVSLVIAIIFPVFEYLLILKKEKHSIYYRFLLSFIVSLFSGIIIYSILSNQNFILYLNRFRGVKISYILPLILIGLLILIEVYDKILKRFNKLDIILIMVFLMLIILIMVLRSGNYLSINELDTKVRNILENIFGIRPRYKEFLIGHPMLLLALWIRKKSNASLYWCPLLIIGLIGQISCINTFCHIIHPFWINLYQCLIGLILGFINGVILITIISFISRIIK